MRRVAMGLSIKDVAERLGLSADEVEAIENGDRRARTEDLYGLARLLDVKIAFFFDCATGIGSAGRVTSRETAAHRHTQVAQV